jgi:ubiquinone/menaquinone biosynthesis C-methylase UbiE
MKRIAEPELMDDKAQAEAYASTDFSEPHDAFVEHFKNRFPEFSKGNVLDLGCGTADVIIRFAKVFPKTGILGVDGAQSMIDIGLQDIKKQGLDKQITLRKCMLPDKELSNQAFDAAISNSLLHHLADPLILWEVMDRCAKPGAPVYTMDLLRPDNPEIAKEIVKVYAADAPLILKEDFYNSLLASYTIEEIKNQLLTVNLDYFNIEVISDRHVLVWGIKNG